MSKQNYYLGQGPWIIIKEYLGIFKKNYAYSKFMELELEVIEEAWGKHAGRHHACRNRKSPRPRPTPYTKQVHKWEKTNYPLTGYSNPLLASAIDFAYEKREDESKILNAAPRPGWGCTPRPLNSRLAATIVAMNIIHQEDELLTTPKVKNTNNLTGLDRHELDLTRAATKQAVMAYEDCVTLGKQQIFRACVNNPNRKMIYEALDKATRLGKRKCLCGCVVATHTKAFERHLKTITHTKQLSLEANTHAIEAWYHYSGVMPPGFERSAVGRWIHIIPADPGRGLAHRAGATWRAFNMCDHISNSPCGSGYNRINAIV